MTAGPLRSRSSRSSLCLAAMAALVVALFAVTDASTNAAPSPRRTALVDIDRATGLPRLVALSSSSSSSNDDSLAAATPAQIQAVVVDNVSGWSDLTIVSGPLESPDSTDDTSSGADVAVAAADYLATMRAAGYAEGLLTCHQILLSLPNFYVDNFGKAAPGDDLLGFIADNYAWTQAQAQAKYLEDPYWLTVGGVLSQLQGVLEGVHAAKDCVVDLSAPEIELELEASVAASLPRSADELTITHLLLLNAWGDIYTIQSKFSNNETANALNDGLHKRITYPGVEIERDLRCSSLFKLLPDFSDVIFGHTTWSSYYALGPRTFKHYTLPAPVASLTSFELRESHFSSSPGILASLDDFYVLSSPSASMAVIETTHDVLNTELFQYVVPESNLCWLRVVVANSLAVSGNSWSELFANVHSGTYNNQWQIMDMTKFVAGSAPAAGFFTLLEEIPSKVVYRDATDLIVSKLYWASYNVPFFPEISVESGNEKACRIRSLVNETEYCWLDASRANIFRARQSSVSSVEDFKELINYNNWQADSLSMGDPCKAIACRRDLEPHLPMRYPSGGLDAKVSSISMAQAFFAGTRPDVATIRNGPTNDQQPTFCWSDLKKPYLHVGQPDCFDFDFIAVPQVIIQ